MSSNNITEIKVGVDQVKEKYKNNMLELLDKIKRFRDVPSNYREHFDQILREYEVEKDCSKFRCGDNVFGMDDEEDTIINIYHLIMTGTIFYDSETGRWAHFIL